MKKFLAACREARNIVKPKYTRVMVYELLWFYTPGNVEYHKWLGKKTVKQLRNKFGTT